MQATIIFEKNWEAIHAMAFNEDGSPTLDENGKHQRKYKVIINEGSSRSSKTLSLIDCYDLYARENNNKRLTVWRDTKTDCKKTILNDTIKRFKQTGRYKVNQDFNKTESIFTYSTDSTFEIHGTDDEETVHGLEQDAAWLNEPYKISKDTFDQIDQRTSDFVFIDWNPKKAHWIEDLKKDSRTLVIHSTFKDNPFCPVEQRIKILSYQPVSMCFIGEEKGLQFALTYNEIKNPLNYPERAIKELIRCRENEFKKSASEFNWSVYGLGIKAEQPNRIFSWEEIQPSIYDNLQSTVYTGVDWGSVDPWGIVDAKYYDGGLYLKQRNYTSENELRKTLSSTELQQINGSEEGIVTWMFKKLGIPFNRDIICDTNRNTKIAALYAAGWDYAQPASKLPGSILDGIDVLQNLRVYFTSDSVDLKYEQENYSRKVVQGIVMEEPEDMNNHCMDCCRYIALYLQLMGVVRKI